MKRILRITSITLLTVVFLALFLWKSNLRDVGRILRTTNLLWLVAGLLVNFATLFFRTIRWRVLIDDKNPPGFYPTFTATTIGYMLSNVLPIRAGDVARPALLARRTPVTFSKALGTVLTERVLDVISILSLFLFFCLRRWNDYDSVVVHGGAVGAGTMLAVTLAMVIMIFFFSAGFRRLHERVGRLLPIRFREAWMRFFDAFSANVQLVTNPLGAAVVLLSTAGVWFCLTAQYWCVFFASHRLLPLDASLFLSAATTVGVAIPTPGGIGGFHKLSQYVLTTFYGLDIDSSVAVTVLLHVVSTLPVIVAGLLLFVHEGLKWREVSRETRVEKRDIRE